MKPNLAPTQIGKRLAGADALAPPASPSTACFLPAAARVEQPAETSRSATAPTAEDARLRSSPRIPHPRVDSPRSKQEIQPVRRLDQKRKGSEARACPRPGCPPRAARRNVRGALESRDPGGRTHDRTLGEAHLLGRDALVSGPVPCA